MASSDQQRSLPAPHPHAPAGRPPDRPLSGILLAISSGILFTISDACAKILTADLPIIEIVWLRWFGFVFIVLPAIVMSGGGILRSRARPLQTLRSLFLVGSSIFFIAGLGHLPIATATTINFVAPLLVAALSIPFLGEQVGWRRWLAILVGLLGVLIVVRPGSGSFDLASLFPIASATCWALGIVCTRKLAGVDPPWTAMCYAALVGFAILTVAVLPDFVMPSGTHLVLAAFLAFLATGGQYMTLLAFQRAPVSLLAPFSYVQLIWSTTAGYLLFGNLPDGWTAIGASIIVASGIYTAHRERIRARDEARARREARAAEGAP